MDLKTAAKTILIPGTLAYLGVRIIGGFTATSKSSLAQAAGGIVGACVGLLIARVADGKKAVPAAAS